MSQIKVKLTIGDWSQDGHNQYDEFVYSSNKTVQEIQQAYKNSCKLTGLSFNHSEDYTGLNLTWDHPERNDRQIAVEYESYTISKLAESILLTHGIDVWEGYEDAYDKKEDMAPIDGEEHFITILLDFIKLSLPDLILEESSFKKSELRTMDAINGWWNTELNHQFGYGLYE